MSSKEVINFDASKLDNYFDEYFDQYIDEKIYSLKIFNAIGC